ncbi:hypothetical protein MTO96_019025 [Rhipicephalus appendiculatus]
MDIPRASPRTSRGQSSLKSDQHSRQASDAAPVERNTANSGGRADGSPATSSAVTKSSSWSSSSSTVRSEKQPSSKGSRLSKVPDDLRGPQPRRRSGTGSDKARGEITGKDEHGEVKRRSMDESTTRSAREGSSSAAPGEDAKRLEESQHRTSTSATSPRGPQLANHRQDSGPWPPVPAPRRDVSPRPATIVDTTPRTHDGKDLAATPMEVKDGEKTLLENSTATRSTELSRRGDVHPRRALIPRKSTVEDVVSLLCGPVSERSAATPAERRDGSVQPLTRSSLSPSTKPRPAPRSPYLKKPNGTNDERTQITETATSGERALSSTTDAPYVTAASSLPASVAAEPSSLPSLREERRPTCCTPDLRHDESVNDSLRGTRLSSPEQKAAEPSTVQLHEQPLTLPHEKSDSGSKKLKASSENVNGAAAAGSVATSSKMSSYATAVETIPTNKVKEEPRSGDNTRTAAITNEGVRPTTATQEEGSQKSQQVSRISDKERRDHQESSKSAAAPKSAHTGSQSAGTAPKALPVGKEKTETTGKSVPKADAPNDVHKPPTANADEGKKATSEAPEGEKPAKSVKIAPEQPSPPEANDASQGNTLTTRDEWCDRLGLWLLPNKTNLAKDPCVDFYEYVCYDWSVGRETTPFLGSIVDSAYRIISQRIERSTLPPETRNDLDLFVAFIKATIKQNLVYGLPTIVGVRVGRSQSRPDQTGLFLSVDGCLITLFSLNSSDTRAIESLIREIVHELPEFRDVINAATQLTRLALAINLTRGAPTEEVMHCRSLGVIVRGVNASTWLKEINRYVPANVTLNNGSWMYVHEVTNHGKLYRALQGRPSEIRALYINLITVGQILQYRQSHATQVQSKLRVCMHASRDAFRNLWVQLMMDVAGLHVLAKYLEKLFEDIKLGLVADLKARNVTGLSMLAVEALLNKTQLQSFVVSKLENDTVYKAPQLSIGYHMPQYLVQTSAFQTQRSFNQLVDEYSLVGDKEEITFKPKYNTDDLTISLHFFMLFPPVFYVYREELFHNFATLGVLLALELIKEASRRFLLNTQAAAQSGQTCPLEPASDTEIQELIVWQLGVGAALRSLEMYAKQSMSPLETMLYGQRLRMVFFERFCMLSCMPPDLETKQYKRRCVLPAMNLREFSVAYQCAPKGTHGCSQT